VLTSIWRAQSFSRKTTTSHPTYPRGRIIFVPCSFHQNH